MRDEGNTWSGFCEECYEADLSDEFSHCPYCGEHLLEPYVAPRRTVRQRLRRAWLEVQYKLGIKERPPLDHILEVSLANYKDAMIENIFSESTLMTYLKEKNERPRQYPRRTR